jgi:hypothetical protein
LPYNLFLPVSSGSAAAKASTTEAAKTVATAAVVATTSQASPTEAASHPGTTPPPSAEEAEEQENAKQRKPTKEKEDENEEKNREATRVMTNNVPRLRGCVVQRDMRIGCNDLGELAHSQRQGTVIVTRAQIRYHCAANVSDLGVVQNTLEPITDIDSIFVDVNRKQYKHTAVGAFGTDLPGVFELIGPIGGIVAVKIVHDDHCNLRFGIRVVELASKIVDPGNRLWGEYMDEIADVIGGLGKIFNLLGFDHWNQQNCNADQQPPTDQAMYTAKGVHLISLYEAAGA